MIIGIQDIFCRELGQSSSGGRIQICFMAKSQSSFLSPCRFLARLDNSVFCDYSSQRVANNLFASKDSRRVSPIKSANVVWSSPSPPSDSSICLISSIVSSHSTNIPRERHGLFALYSRSWSDSSYSGACFPPLCMSRNASIICSS